MKIEIGNYKIVHSGVVIHFSNEPILITLSDKVEGDYTIIFNFVKDEKNVTPQTKITPLEKFKLQIDFINFENATNVANTELIFLGTLERNKLYVNYRITNFKGVGMTVLFNFVTLNEVPNAI